MPTHKADLSLLSISQLATVTGHTRATVAKRVGAKLDPVRTDGRTKYYSAPAAVGIVCGTGSGLDLSEERARLARAQTEATELRNATTRGELVPAREVLEHWANQVVATRAHLRAIPSQIAGELPHLTADEIVTVRRLIDRACAELADGLPATTKEEPDA